MNSIKQWCYYCRGIGIVPHFGNEICMVCDGKGWNTLDVPEMTEKPYGIEDARADAEVLGQIVRCKMSITDQHLPTNMTLIEIRSTIINRLHAFYCGGES